MAPPRSADGVNRLCRSTVYLMSDPCIRFPSKSLAPKGGEMYCHIFENSSTGLVRNLFWSITVEFEPVQYGENEFSCAMTCEWIPWPVRNWRELDGRRLVADYGEHGVESSFYTTQHDIGTRTELALFHRKANLFAVKMDMLVDYRGYYGGDDNPAMAVHAEVDVPFIGLLIIPDNLSPKPATPSQLQSVASQFVDLSSYEAPKPWQGHGSIFPPAV